MSGKVGQVVVKRRDGKYYVATPPIHTKPPTEKQLEHREKFAKAIRYAKMATDEESPDKETYEEAAETASDGRSPMNMAVSDWFHPPEIDEVDFSEYHGRAGDVITILLKNEAKVDSVKLTISDADGNLLERGEATRRMALVWDYTATQDLPGDDATFVISVTDLPGNTAEESLEHHLVNFGAATS